MLDEQLEWTTVVRNPVVKVIQFSSGNITWKLRLRLIVLMYLLIERLNIFLDDWSNSCYFCYRRDQEDNWQRLVVSVNQHQDDWKNADQRNTTKVNENGTITVGMTLNRTTIASWPRILLTGKLLSIKVTPLQRLRSPIWMRLWKCKKDIQ